MSSLKNIYTYMCVLFFYKKITYIFKFVRKILNYKVKLFEEYCMYIYVYNNR